MSGCMATVQTMASMGKVMDPQQTAKTMQEFERQNMKMEMTEDMSNYHKSLFVCLSVCLSQHRLVLTL